MSAEETSEEIAVISVDVGGTFTDVTVIYTSGNVRSAKVLSTPSNFSVGILEGIEAVCGPDTLLPHLVIHGTTVATNAVLSRQGLGRAALVTTRGFRDVLEIGRTQRPNMYQMDWDKPTPIITRDLIFEVDERVEPNGAVVSEPSDEEIDRLVRDLADAGVSAVAVCLINSYANPVNEEKIAARLREEHCVTYVTAATSVTRELQEFERTSTAALNAALMQTVTDYIENLSTKLDAKGVTGLFIMQSNGGLIPADQATQQPVSLLESGPAAGVLGAAKLTDALGLDKAIAFDMGGTTAKASLIEGGTPREAPEYEVGGDLNKVNPLLRGGGYTVRLPCLELCEVGAGGGSIAWVDDAGALRVGPHSAGADPGPACYGRGGTDPTVADAQLVLGYLAEGQLGTGAVHLDFRLAQEAIERGVATPLGVSVEAAATAMLSIANVTMARAIRAVTVERGRDPSQFTLVASGGSGPIHAVSVAQELGIRHVAIPSLAGVFSALAMSAADLRRDAVMSVQWSIANASTETFLKEFDLLESDLRAEFEAAEVPGSRLRFRRTIDARYRGQSGRIEIEIGDRPVPADIVESFEAQHEQLFGHRSDSDEVEAVALRVGAIVESSVVDIARLGTQRDGDRTQTRAFFEGHGWVDVPVFEGRGGLADGLEGPLIVWEENSTTLVPPGCSSHLSDSDVIMIDVPPRSHVSDLKVSGLSIEVVRHRLEAIVDEMAALIPQAARSLMARESHDFSTALCNPTGDVIAQGLGSLIHLGSAPWAIKAVRAHFGDDLHAGDVYLLNDPYDGGTHLPDMILVMPIFADAAMLGFAVVISHHSDVGGGVPGGHATGATDLYQEGLIVPPVRLVDAGRMQDDVWRIVVRNTRAESDMVGDLQAQLAACRKAASQLVQLSGEITPASLIAAMDGLLDYTEKLTRTHLSRLPDGTWSAIDYIDDDGSGKPLELAVDLSIVGDRVVVDFSKSSPQIPNGLNCNLGTLASAVYLGFQCLFGGDVPDNGGFGRPFDITATLGTVVNPRDPAPVAARGLTGFRLADLMYKVLSEVVPEQVWAAGEGGLAVVTMGGSIGHRRYLLIDTVGGGSGARPDKDGVEGIASAIGNCRNNSAEVVERDFPIHIHRYGFVPDTGGQGRFRGANAMVKEYELLAEQGTVFVRSDRRRFQPWGLQGGQPGAPSAVELLRHGSDQWELLPVMHVFSLYCGDRLRVTTAGAGGYGPPQERAPEDLRRDLVQGRFTSWPPLDGDAASEADSERTSQVV